MPSLKDLKNRISSVKNTRKITKAMQMVAAAKLRRAQEAAEDARPYAERFNAVMAGLAASVGQSDTAPKLLAGTGSDQVQLLVVMTAERGLCGGFNANIAKLARQKVLDLQAAGKTVKILTVGKKGRDVLKREFGDLFVGHVDLTEVKRVGYVDAQGIAKDILARFDAGEFDVATIFYSKFQNVVTQIPTAQQIIPAEFDAEGAEATSGVVDYEPSEEAILADLLPRGVATQIFAGLLENGASEQGARMSAMDNATRNAGEMIDKLTIEYNRSRQAVITNELIEIISGAEAL
ncbi:MULTISPECIES: F0F1 ATP synthase subunit gamma [Rhodobacterales]|jgi:F-type H+-transporting ATPase subunit gamma|uniref:ATP synthase gamma chain n=1 Tax=Ruegeria sp. (strain TM1040) TaxID=292414 RepID=ATPG_RUEST|nr:MULTISPECIES: F0F1 ATP synthase subunit gamma [Roseobacteraceae]Q1GEU7.1 RecName: Full=ATP synthase gamma chain; AltName: Full=ATP synthase F1 sector gamma subunit; AltName: Full=F-ATPase gamma subunit [Ruegeria sp. TM1040]MDF9303390.1 F0F1 ATP synthase subunit gamma [Tritonibacter mobilis]ABF64819.1 ATP synthase F1 gamma subunit [Ruegeria sp. TM1040]MCG7622825.1 F0F1 ATP synthase subunit gamma [Epibacterium sp. Ofav1-8]MCG7627676.1 F0F1 ATP synthase subunit gamma [Epibacterium sp. MM17-32]